MLDERRYPLGAISIVAPQVRDGVLAALAYADVFAWPLSASEIHRTLPVQATAHEVERALDLLVTGGTVARRDGLHVLWGRTELIGERRQRAVASTRLWRRANRCGRVIGVLPFVRMVAISGSLAVDAADADADIDLFIVTADGRLWTTRALVLLLTRVTSWGRGRRSPLCPNYLVVESALTLTNRDRFTAHELVQLVPLVGNDVYDELLERNAWFREHLPNHPGNGPARLAVDHRPARSRIERLLRGPSVERFERWEMRRKVARLGGDDPVVDARFDERTCKGHVDGHRPRILDAYRSRLERLGLTS